MKVSVIAPVLNEAPWIGYSIMAALPHVHEFVYGLDAASSDGTRELLAHIKAKYAFDKLKVLDLPTFHPSDMQAYNQAFDDCIQASTGDAIFFLHPDMVVTKWHDLDEGPLAWWTQITSYAGDFNTVISTGRTDKWKNIHRKKFGLVYRGGYGSQNEDFYHSDITEKSYRHFGTDFYKYPYEVRSSGIEINHYCELKDYSRRLEKMKLCLKTIMPYATDEEIDSSARAHPRVSLDTQSKKFGSFEFKKTDLPIPDVITKYREEFDQKELVHG